MERVAKARESSELWREVRELRHSMQLPHATASPGAIWTPVATETGTSQPVIIDLTPQVTALRREATDLGSQPQDCSFIRSYMELLVLATSTSHLTMPTLTQ